MKCIKTALGCMWWCEFHMQFYGVCATNVSNGTRIVLWVKNLLVSAETQLLGYKFETPSKIEVRISYRFRVYLIEWLTSAQYIFEAMYRLQHVVQNSLELQTN